jgi:uncharacterized membrane protein
VSQDYNNSAHRQEDQVESKATLFGHSIHQMLIPFPLGLLSTAAIFDAIYSSLSGPARARGGSGDQA